MYICQNFIVTHKFFDCSFRSLPVVECPWSLVDIPHVSSGSGKVAIAIARVIATWFSEERVVIGWQTCQTGRSSNQRQAITRTISVVL